MKGLRFGIILVVLSSCDPFSQGFIKNDSNGDVVLVARLDRNITKHYGASVTDFLTSFSDDSTSIAIRLDTSNLIGIYRLKRGASILTDESNDRHCTTKFDYLQIWKADDTITYYSNEEIAKAFSMNKAPAYHELTIE